MQAQDAVTSYLFKSWAWIQRNAREAVIGVVILIIVIFVISFHSWRQGQKEIEAGNALSHVLLTGGAQMADACLKVASDYPGTLAGQRASLVGATELFKTGRYADAQAQFQKILDAHPDGSFAPQAQLGIATSLEAQGKLDLAATAYQRVINASDLDVAAVGRLGLAQIQKQQGKLADAQKNYEEVMRSVPNSSLASEATMLASQSKTIPSEAVKPTAPTPSFNLSH